MRYAFMSFSCPELEFGQMLEAATRFGYDGVEMRIAEDHAHGLELDTPPALRREARAKAEAAGIAICCVATSCRFADPETAEAHVRDGLAAIDLAADLGASRLRVFGGTIGDGLERAAAVDLVAGGLRQLAEKAADRHVSVCVETHDDWSDARDVAAVLRRVNHPAIVANWDIMHPVLSAGTSMDTAFEALRPWITHVHVHDGIVGEDGRLSLCPIGEGGVDHRRALSLLRGMGYDGFISGEWIGWESWDVHLPRELDRLKQAETG